MSASAASRATRSPREKPQRAAAFPKSPTAPGYGERNQHDADRDGLQPGLEGAPARLPPADHQRHRRLGDGRVNIGLAIHDAEGPLRRCDHRALMRWLRSTPREWGLADERNADGPASGGALPMGFARRQEYQRGVLLVGDAGGVVNPFTGEGVAYAMEAGELAAQVLAEALVEPLGPARERVLRGYARSFGGRNDAYYRLGSRFVDLVDHPRTMDIRLRLLLPWRPTMVGLLRGSPARCPRADDPVAERSATGPFQLRHRHPADCRPSRSAIAR